MSTRIGIIAEGPIDHALLPVLLERIALERASFGWPVAPDDVAEVFQIRKRGHGGVLETVRRLVLPPSPARLMTIRFTSSCSIAAPVQVQRGNPQDVVEA